MMSNERAIALVLTGVIFYLGFSFVSTVEAVPLGIRTNNPGNIIQTNIKWRGEIECDSRFECFDTARHGIRAMSKNLLSYQDKHKLKTITQIIRRWSPPNENDTGLLSHVVRGRLHVIIGSDYNLRAGENLKNLVIALIKQENGYNPYSNKMIEEITNELTNTNGSNNHVNRSRSGRLNEDVGNESGDSSKEGRVLLQDESIKEQKFSGCKGNKERGVSVDTESNSSYFSILSNFITQIGSYIFSYNRGNCRLDTVESGVPILRGVRGSGVEDSKRIGDNAP